MMMIMMMERAKWSLGSELSSYSYARIKMHLLLYRCINVDVFYFFWSAK